MAVQIPNLNRIPVQADATAGRLDVNVPDMSRPVAQIGQQLEGVGSKLEAYAAQEELHAIDVQAQAIANDYEAKYKTSLKAADAIKGDPTETYTKLRDDTKGWAQESAAPYEDTNVLNPMSFRLRDAVRDKIAKVNTRLDDTAAVRETAQYNTWKEAVKTTGVTNNQESMIDGAETLDAKDPKSMARIANAVNEIVGLHEADGVRTGLVTVGADGTKQISPILREQIRKDVSKGLITTIETLNASGKTEEAQMIMDRYGDEMIGKDRLRALKQEHTAAVQDKTAYTEADKYKNMPYEQAMRDIEKRKDLEPKVREKMELIVDGYRRRMENAKTSRQKESFEQAAQIVMNNRQNYNDVLDLEGNPVVKNALNKMSPDQRKKVEALVAKGPSQSDPDVEGAMYDSFKSGEMRGWSMSDFVDKAHGLSQKDMNKWKTRFVNESTDTATEKNRLQKQIVSNVDRFIGDYGITKTSRSQSMGKKDQRNRSYAIEAVTQELGDIPPNTPPAELAKMVESIIVKKKKDGLFTGEKRDADKFQGAPARTSAPPAAPVTRPTGAQPVINTGKVTKFSQLDKAGQVRAMEAWAKAHGNKYWTKDDTTARLDAFVAKGF